MIPEVNIIIGEKSIVSINVTGAQEGTLSPSTGVLGGRAS